MIAVLFILSCIGHLALAANTTVACNNSPTLCGRAYNNITHLGAHDSPFLRNAATGFSVAGDQFYNTTVQLDAGVRLLTAQLFHQNSSSSSPWHVCHTSCALLDAGPVVTWLAEINAWMEKNPNDVVTLLLVNQQSTTVAQFDSLFSQSGLTQFKYTPANNTAPPAKGQWPTLGQLINNGTRLITFIAKLNSGDTPAAGSSTAYLLDEFDFIFENPYSNSALNNFSCTADRPTALAGKTEQALSQHLMPWMNHFLYSDEAFGIQTSNTADIATVNAPTGSTNGSVVGSLGQSAATCTSQYGRAPTYLLVDFFNVGPAITEADKLNGINDVTGRTSVSTAAAAVKYSSLAASWRASDPMLIGLLIGLVALCI